MNKLTKALVGVLLAQAVAATVAAEGMSLRLGMSYRDFDAAEFGAVAFRGAGTQANAVGPYGVQNVMAVLGAPLGTPFTIDYVRLNDANTGFGSRDNLSPVLGFENDLGIHAGLALSLVGNFQVYLLDSRSGYAGNSAAPGNFAFEQWRHFVVAPGGILSPGAFLVAAPGTTFSARNAFDMDLYVLDLGMSARTTGSALSFTVAAGPTLNITRTITSQRTQVSWPAQGLLAAGTQTESVGDSSEKLLLGLYAALGLAYDLSEEWSVAGEFRYDYIDRDAGTSQADMDLSSGSGQITLRYRF